MCVYYDKKGRKYKGRKRICEVCKKEEIVRESNQCKNCQSCDLEKRKSFIDPSWILTDYIDSTGCKYKGRIRKCSVCGDEKIVRITIKSNICKSCRTRNRKSTPDLYLMQDGIKRGAEYRKCECCGKTRLCRKDTSKDTGLCNTCHASKHFKELGNKWGSIIGKIYGPKRYKTGIGSYRKNALEHFKESCLCCKIKSNDEKIMIHHIDENRENNDILNLIPLCRSCHQLIHFRLKKGMTHDEAFSEVKKKKSDD